MLESEIIKFIAEPDKISEPEQSNQVIAYLNGLITDLESEEFEDELKVNQKWNELRYGIAKVLLGGDTALLERRGFETNAQTDRQIKLEPEYAEWKKTQRTLAKLKRNRQTLQGRMRFLENKLYRKY